MNTFAIILLILVSLLLVAVVFFAFGLYKNYRAPQTEDSSNLTLLQQQLESLRSQLSESMTKTHEIVNQQLSQVTSQVQQQLSSVNQSMLTTSGQINTRLDSYSQIVQNVSRQLGSLSEATEKIFEATKNITALENILKPPKLRGGMGEILLENSLREILPSEEFFTLQYSFKTGDTVDAVIRLKEGLISIDAKFPLDNFRKMIETKEEKEKQQSRKEFVRNVKKHIDDIAKKYILPDEGTLHFALMYIPAENVYYETIIRDERMDDSSPDIYSYATQKHVFPVSPNSLYPYLMTLALGFRGLKIEQQAKEILSELMRMQGDLEKFSKDFRLVGSHLSDAQKKFSEAEKKLDRMETKLESLKEGTPQIPKETLSLEGRGAG